MNPIDKRISEIKEVLGITPKALEGAETKANEVMHTTNNGAGAELIPENVLLNEVVNLIPTYSSLLSALPGNHGTNMPKSATVPVLGEVGFFQGEDEWTNNSTADEGIYDGVVGNGKPATAEISINQKKLVLRIPISDDQLRYSVKNVEEWVKSLIAQSAARTIESMIINADVDGDINNLTGAGNAKHHTRLGHVGLRSVALADATMKYDMGAMDATDFFALNNILGDLAANPADILFLMSRSTLNKASTIDTFLEAYKSGKDSTIHTGAIGNLLGSDVFVARDFWKTNATGVIDAVGTNNVKGGVIAMHKSAVQYGFGQEFKLEVVRVPAKGIMLIGYFDFGFSIVNKLAGQTDPTVALGYNATLF